MRKQLQLFHEIYKGMDDTPNTCISYTQITATARLEALNSVIDNVVQNVIRPRSEAEYMQETARFKDYLNQHFHGKEWQAHSCHFHTNFHHYVGCPMTCLNEIAETVEKIIKSNFSS